MPALPFKLNQDRRRHIPKQKRRVTNTAAYDAALRQRGSLTVWSSDDAIEGWRAQPRVTAGGQPGYSPLAILTALTLWAVFHLALRQAEGLTGLCLYGAGEWLVEKHGANGGPGGRCASAWTPAPARSSRRR